MLDSIRKFFNENVCASSEEQSATEHRLRLATAALLIEMMLQDDAEAEQEKQAVMTALREKFKLTLSETDELYELACKERKQATDYHQFTSLIAAHFSQSQKIRIIEYLWSVAYADGVLDKYEEHMVRRIADLIHVSHKDFLQAKHKFETKS
jgi:uncharacterized tellurite resistance protein B-like protein